MIENSFEQAVPTRIEKSDIEPISFEAGETEIILQRHGKYERKIEDQKVGSLTKEGAEDAYLQGKIFFKELFALVPESERNKIDILVLASDTQYAEGGRRSMETAEQIMKGIKEVLVTLNLNESQLLNSSGSVRGEGGPRPTPKLREPQIFKKTPDFVNFLKEKYGELGVDFWRAFEEDKEKETREKMNAEGPDEIANRMKSAVNALARYSQAYHEKHPGRRLVIWATTHYDTISPYVKREVLRTGKDAQLEVSYGAGILINLNKDGKSTTKLGRVKYDVPIEA
jgi:hypothetical protein